MSSVAADVLLAELCHSTTEAFEATFGAAAAATLLEPYPQLRALHAHVLALPAIQGFVGGPNWFAFPAGDVGKAYVRNVRNVLS